MSYHNTLFSKLLREIDRRDFKSIVSKYNGDKYAKELTCWDQFVLMMFGQISGCSSGRDAISQFNSFQENLYHIGSRNIAKSTLNDANANRNCKIFEELLYTLIAKAQKIVTPQVVKITL